LRWAVFNEPISPQPNIWKLTKATAIGFTGIALLGRAGEFVRPYLIARAERLSVSSQIAALVLERVFDLLAALLVFSFGLSRVYASGIHAGERLNWVLQTGGRMVFILTAGCIGLLLLNKYYGSKFRKVATWLVRFLPATIRGGAQRFTGSFFDGLQSSGRTSSLLRILLYTAVEWFLIFCTTLFTFYAYGGKLALSLLDVVIFLGFLAFGAVVQIPGVGGGVQVVTILVLTEMFAVPLELASSAAIVLWSMTFVIIVPLGLVLAVREGVEWTKLRSAAQQAKEGAS
jgi:uncharacterized protein (TIRG00374 family)